MSAGENRPPTVLVEPWEFTDLEFSDFPGGTIGDVAQVLYRNEPHFMRALEADVRERGVREPVELGTADTIMEGHHRLAAAYRAGAPVGLVFYGEPYQRDEAEQRRWDAIRRQHPEEYDARMAHDPHHWDRDTATGHEPEAGAIENLTEAGFDVYESDLAAGQLEYDRQDCRRSLYTNTKDDHAALFSTGRPCECESGDDEWVRNGAMNVHFWPEAEAG